MAESPSYQVLMGYVREQLEASREDVFHRLQVISKRLSQHTNREVQAQERLKGVVDVLESTVDVFLRHDSAMEMQLRVSRLWFFISLISRGNPAMDTQVLKFINTTKDRLNTRLNEMWKAPIEEVVPIRNKFRDELKQIAETSGIFK